ncbi:uncharacterized protein LOC127877729 isoform X1 [Dreissena polymorpha]|nr:uncharacterized protein LOC127877729 isoform X1 [Dreissena polymorpha]
MPTPQRPWSTQYADDFNKIRWRPQKLKKRQGPVRVFKPHVSRATEVYIPLEPGAYAGSVHGMEDPLPTLTDDIRRPMTPVVNVENYTQAEPEIPEPEEIRVKSPELHWICWKEHKPSPRPYTSLGLRRTEGIEPKLHGHNAGQPVTYNSTYQSWTNASLENEQKAVDAMFALRRSQSFYEPSYKPMTSISVNDMPPRDTYTGYGNNPDPRSIYQQSFFPYHQAGGAGSREGQVMGQLAKELNGKEPAPFNYNYSFNKYPLHMRKNRRTAATTDDYVHESSMFMSTTPACSGHFIIHPDWVSERSALRRSNSMIQTRNSPKKDGFRY